MPEVSSGSPSPPRSPPLAANVAKDDLVHSEKGRKARRGGAAYTITGECERLFCETLKHVFSGEGELVAQDSLVMDAHTTKHNDRYTMGMKTSLSEWIEIWDYVGGLRFRGFVAKRGDQKSLFVFFERDVVDKDLKPGLLALIELASSAAFDCSRLVICLDRSNDPVELNGLMRDLRWVGFELVTLAPWTDRQEVTSEEWLFLGMEI